MRLDILLAAGALMLASGAQASEVTTYEYDALGRLVKPAEFGEPISDAQKTAFLALLKIAEIKLRSVQQTLRLYHPAHRWFRDAPDFKLISEG